MNEKTFKDSVLIIVSKHERIFRYFFKLTLSLVGFLILNDAYGYMGAISAVWIPIGLSVVCAFMPLSGIAFVMVAYLAIHLFALSLESCAAFLILCIGMALIARGFGAKSMIHIIFMSVLYHLSVPFLAPVFEGYFGKKNEVASLIGGSVVAFYLRVLGLSATGVKNDENQTAFTILRDNVISSQLFYLFLITVAAVFIIIYLVRRLNTRFAWLYAIIFGVAVEFVMMSSGYLLTGNGSRMVQLVIGSVITFGFGFLITYFLADVRVGHQKLLEFEDDEYYYSVICTPKIQFKEDTKRVKRITRSRREMQRVSEKEEGEGHKE